MICIQIGRAAWMKKGGTTDRSKAARNATMSATPARPDGPGAAAAPTKKCSEAERRGAARRRHTRTLLRQYYSAPPVGGANN